LYRFIKIWLQLALRFYIKNIKIQGAAIKQISRPTLLAVNHSNSFLDALIVTAYYPNEIHFLARGDAFNKKWAAWILKNLLNIIPIHRLEEGRENLIKNTESFEEVMQVLADGGSVLIFPEGLCKNENTIRPLRKGAARMAYQAWQQYNIHELNIQPISIRYATFTDAPKTINLFLGQALTKKGFTIEQEAVFYNKFNVVLRDRLQVENTIDFHSTTSSTYLKILMALPALLGYLIHRPFYILLRNFIRKKTKGTVFYDSVLFGSMMLIYPFFVLLITGIAVLISGNNSAFWFLLLLLPLTAWCYKIYRK